MPADDFTSLFIGREGELEWLKKAWLDAKSGKPRFCVSLGESDFGKTKIVQQFYSWLSSDKNEDPDGYWPDFLPRERNNDRLNPSPIVSAESAKYPYPGYGGVCAGVMTTCQFNRTHKNEWAICW